MKGFIMFQKVDGKRLYLVNLLAMPKLPIHSMDSPELAPYAKALNEAIEQKVITEPGQYGIEVYQDEFHELRWNAYKIEP
jgi:hypothetical protein